MKKNTVKKTVMTAAQEAVKVAAIVKAAVIVVVAFIRFFLYGIRSEDIRAWFETTDKNTGEKVPAEVSRDLQLHISRENKKLKPDARTAFIIWNLPAIFTCPGATFHCILSCYAKKAEYSYHKEVLPARVQNYLMSRRADFVELMTKEIMRIAAGTKKQYIIVRVHESGDFYCKAYAEKWLQIMRNCAGDRRIRFIAYTKSFRYFDGVKLPKNFSLRASIWDDTPEADKEIVKRNGWPIYTAVDKFQVGDNFTRCRCSDCAGCRKCWLKYRDIRCEIH